MGISCLWILPHRACISHVCGCVSHLQAPFHVTSAVHQAARKCVGCTGMGLRLATYYRRASPSDTRHRELAAPSTPSREGSHIVPAPSQRYLHPPATRVPALGTAHHPACWSHTALLGHYSQMLDVCSSSFWQGPSSPRPSQHCHAGQKHPCQLTKPPGRCGGGGPPTSHPLHLPNTCQHPPRVLGP